MATKFYLHRGTANPPGTFPSSSALGGTPTVTASGASTLRWLDGTISAVAQTSAATTTDGTSNAQTAWHTRHVSAPLAAQTISAQTLTYSLAASEGNANSNFNPSIYVSLWRPSTGAEVGAILAVGTITATEPGTGQTAVSGTGTSTARTAQAGDVIIIETWRKSVAPGATTARANTTFYDGTTEASTTNVASFVNFANTLTFLAISAAPTAASLTASGATPTVVATDNKTTLPTTASLTASGATPTVTATANTIVQPSAADLTATGATPGVSTPAVSLPTVVGLTATGDTPDVQTPVVSGPPAAGLLATGDPPTVAAAQTYAPTTASLTLGGETPAVAAAQSYSPDAASLVAAGETPDVSVTSGANATALPDPASLTLAAETPIVVAVQVYTPAAAALAITMGTPTVTAPRVVAPSAVGLSVTLAAPMIGARLAVAHVSLVLATDAPTIAFTANALAQPAAAHLSLTGARPAVKVPFVQKDPVGLLPPATMRWPIYAVPAGASLGVAGAVPLVTSFDDGDFFRLLAEIA